MSMKEALHIVCPGIFVRALLPDWILKLTKRLENVKIAFEELQVNLYISRTIDVIFFPKCHHPMSVDVYV